MTKATRELGHGDMSIHIGGKLTSDEIGELASTFNRMVEELNHYINELTETTRAKERVESELQLARGIQQSFIPKDFPDLKKLVGEFLSGIDLEVEQACFGVAGPVLNNRVKITNLDWWIDAGELKDSFNLSHVHLLNDMVAMSAAVPRLSEEDLFTLVPANPNLEALLL